MKQKLRELKGKIDNSTIIVGEFNTPLSIMDRTIRQIKKQTEHLNSTINQLDLTDIYIESIPPNAHSSQVHMEHFPG